MNKRQIGLYMIIAVLLLVCIINAAAVNVGETIPIEGIVDSAGRNSLYVAGKILVANEYSSISTGGTNIYIGDCRNTDTASCQHSNTHLGRSVHNCTRVWQRASSAF